MTAIDGGLTTTSPKISPIGDLLWIEESKESSSLVQPVSPKVLKGSSTSNAAIVADLLSVSLTAPDYLTLFPSVIFQQLCSAAKMEVFEYGMESDYSRKLAQFIDEFQGLAIETIADFLSNNKVDEEVAAETLRQMGHSEHTPTHIARQSLLVSSLTNRSLMVRDGAILGLASMDDPVVIPLVEQAVKTEPDPVICHNMKDLLIQLCETQISA